MNIKSWDISVVQRWATGWMTGWWSPVRGWDFFFFATASGAAVGRT